MSPSRAARCLAVACVAVALAGCGGEPDLRVGPATAAEPSAGTSQVVVAIDNRGRGDDALLGARTDAAAGVEIHRTRIEGGVATMQRQPEAELPAGATVRFRPGDLHLMLVDADGALREGDTFALELDFARSDDVTVDVDVVPLSELADDALAE